LIEEVNKIIIRKRLQNNFRSKVITFAINVSDTDQHTLQFVTSVTNKIEFLHKTAQNIRSLSASGFHNLRNEYKFLYLCGVKNKLGNFE